MSTDNTKAVEYKTPSRLVRLADASRRLAHLAQEILAVKSLAGDSIEDGVYRARRAVRRGVERLEDEGVHYVRLQPLKTVALVAGVALMVGFATGWIAARSRS